MWYSKTSGFHTKRLLVVKNIRRPTCDFYVSHNAIMDTWKFCLSILFNFAQVLFSIFPLEIGRFHDSVFFLRRPEFISFLSFVII